MLRPCVWLIVTACTLAAPGPGASQVLVGRVVDSGTGRYRIRTSRLGYADYTSAELDLLAGDTVEVQVRIGMEAIPLGR